MASATSWIRRQRHFEVVFEEGESALVEAIVGAQDLSVWATLMPAVYQLVPGSMIMAHGLDHLPAGAGGWGEESCRTTSSRLDGIVASLALGLILGRRRRVGASFLYWLCFCGCGPPALAVGKAKKVRMEIAATSSRCDAAAMGRRGSRPLDDVSSRAPPGSAPTSTHVTIHVFSTRSSNFITISLVHSSHRQVDDLREPRERLLVPLLDVRPLE